MQSYTATVNCKCPYNNMHNFVILCILYYPTESSGSSFSTGAIFGTVVGGIVCIAIIAIIVVIATIICYQYRKGKSSLFLYSP